MKSAYNFIPISINIISKTDRIALLSILTGGHHLFQVMKLIVSHQEINHHFIDFGVQVKGGRLNNTVISEYASYNLLVFKKNNESNNLSRSRPLLYIFH